MGIDAGDTTTAGTCPYPVEEFNNYLHGPVLSHVETIDRLRDRAPFIRSTFGPGFWVLNDGGLVREALQRPDLFSSSVVTVLDPDPQYKWIPEMLDPPEHTAWRQLLAPSFTAKRLEQIAPKVERRCIELIESFAGNGHCDFLRDFAWKYPTTIFMELMGLPLEGLDQFMGWVHDILHLTVDEDPDRSRAAAAMGAVMGYFAELIEHKRKTPGPDLLSDSLEWRIGGEPIPMEDLLAWCLLMFMAGLDTVSIQLSYSFWYLAQHPQDRQRLVAEPGLAATAVEEFLRYFSFVAPARKAKADTDFHGCPVSKGDMVLVPLSALNRDPALFPDAESVVIDRAINGHAAFGLGPHRCLGSHLARRELRVALEEWHRRIPDYRLTEGVEVMEHGGMYGIDSLELSWG
ncbi:MAG: cytochrome [Acidimicrobiia bacterium]|nr:cytochrome [Acidimicrobiia bacterium]